MAETRIIDGLEVPVVRPASVAEAAAVIPNAPAVYPVGGGTMLGFGRSPVRPGIALDLRGLDAVIDFPARDMTITVQAGITLRKLADVLTAEHLRLPIDVPRADTATLGGALSANVSGPRRFGFGTLRDYLIGVTSLNDEGKEFKSGGRVVKNVAGYDIAKLLVGSLGTLGIITQATLKLRPLAEESALISISCAAAGLAGLIDRLMASRTRPVILDAVDRRAAGTVFAAAGLPKPDADWTVLVGFEGNGDAVKWQIQQLVREVGVEFPFEARVGCTNKLLGAALVNWLAGSDSAMTLKASLRPGAVAAFAAAVTALGREPQLRLHAGSGIVHGHYAIGRDEAIPIVSAWRRLAGDEHAVVVLRCPVEWKSLIDVWGPPPASIDMMRKVKAAFDPRDVLNPGRFVA